MSIESGGDFLVSGKLEIPKSPIEYEKMELEAELAAFSPEAQAVIKKFLADKSLDATEAQLLSETRNQWWEAKYGFPHGRKSERKEVLMRKYAPAEELKKAHALQERMFSALGGGAPEEEIRRLKAEYLQQYPDQLEGVELLFGMKPFLELSRALSDPSNKIENPKERRRMYQSLTESHFLLTHFLLTNNKDKAFLGLFWSSIEKVALQAGLSRELNAIRRGTVTQVATMRIFEQLGTQPRLSHPRDDAFNSIDMWSDASHAVQVKSTQQEPAEIIMETDEIAFPGAEVHHDGGISHFNSKLFHDAQQFRAKLDRYREASHQPDLKGFFVVVPYSKVDFVTGEPDNSLVQAIKVKLDESKALAA